MENSSSTMYASEVRATVEAEEQPVYNSAKAAHVFAYLALKSRDRALDMLKAVKLIYLADRENLRRFAMPILDEPRASLPQGPVNSRTYDYMKDGVVTDPAWTSVLSARVDAKIAVREGIVADDLDELSDAEMETLDVVWRDFGGMGQWQLVAWTHDPANVPEWTDPKGSSTPIRLESIMEAVGIKGAAARALFLEDQADIGRRHFA